MALLLGPKFIGDDIETFFAKNNFRRALMSKLVLIFKKLQIIFTHRSSIQTTSPINNLSSSAVIEHFFLKTAEDHV